MTGSPCPGGPGASWFPGAPVTVNKEVMALIVHKLSIAKALKL
jgi:hypothetical protein